MTKHLPIGGSTIARTLNCTAWIERSAQVKRRKAGEAANLGNLLHDSMEEYYKDGLTFEDQIEQGRTFADLALNDTHIPILYQMTRAVEQVLDDYDIDVLLLEPFVEYIPELAGGSIDMLGFSADGKTALTLDYKTGMGVVRAEQNKQLQFYTLSAMVDPKTAQHFEKVEKFIGAIVQPRIFGDRADVWEYDPQTITQTRNEIDEAIAQVHDNPTAEAGTHCKFCPFEPFCEEKQQRAVEATLLDPKHHATLDRALPLALELKAWCDSVIDTATEYASAGITLKDHKLVRGRTQRKWGDTKLAEDLLTEALGKNAYSKKVLTPSQAMTKLKGSDFFDSIAEQIVKPEGKLSIVSTQDPREAVIVEKVQEKLNKMFDK